jgi:hypothetical protein
VRVWCICVYLNKISHTKVRKKSFSRCYTHIVLDRLRHMARSKTCILLSFSQKFSKFDWFKCTFSFVLLATSFNLNIPQVFKSECSNFILARILLHICRICSRPYWTIYIHQKMEKHFLSKVNFGWWKDFIFLYKFIVSKLSLIDIFFFRQ